MARNLPSAADATAAWKTGFAGAGTKWANGVNSVDVAPGQLAVAAQPRYLAGVQMNVGKWAANTQAVSLAQWKATTVQKGQGRLASGAEAGATKYQAKIQAVLQAEASIIGSLPPRGTVEQNIQRSAQFQMAMHQAFAQGG
ncbi:MAG TPA: hypothetical protein VGS19_04420 [Streptosporangiaceae bacterium]|nr:hypothetical protein [Streptosporangiaceae bacterium]